METTEEIDKMKKILGTGLSGMLGSCIVDELHSRYEFFDMSFDSGVDIRDRESLRARVKEVDADIILHLAAKADVDGCENDRQKDKELLSGIEISSSTFAKIEWDKWKDIRSAFAVNVYGSYNVASVCKELNKKLIYISTDFVFDGKEKALYTEGDTPNPINYYGLTKYWGEMVVEHILDDFIIARLAFPYGTHHEIRRDFVQMIRDRFEKNQSVSGVVDQMITPTYAPDIACAIDHLITHSISRSIVHICGSESLSPYDSVVAIAKQFGYDTQMIQKITSEDFYKNRAPRPQYLSISNKKMTKRGVSFKTFTEGLKHV